MSNETGNGQDANQVTQEQVADDFDRLTESYEQEIGQSLAFSGMEHQFFIDKKRDMLLALANAQFGDVGKLDVLDLGCGLGGYHPGLKDIFHSLHGTDVSKASVDMAAKRHSWVEYSSYDGKRLPYADNSFDVVFTITVMHHVPPEQWLSFVAEMHRVLKSGGISMVFEHNPYNPATQYIVRSCVIDKDAVLLKPYVMRRLFKNAGFNDVLTRTMFTVPPKGPFLSVVDAVFGYLPIGAQYYLKATKK
ncbi:MAG: methyltransferase domain-containing protein [Candidatus Devosia symbiotica]|nr:methyltransferase domain-containing protein [Candidatus Devosia symbiotica]